MKESYKCSCCECWYPKSKIDSICYSSKKGLGADLCVYIKCKNCKKLNCLGSCKYMPNVEDKGER